MPRLRGLAPDDDVYSMLRENLAAERVIIATYQEIIRWIGDGDILDLVGASADRHGG